MSNHARALAPRLCILAAVLVACSGGADPGPEGGGGSAGGERPVARGADFATSTTGFGLDLYRALAARPGNLAVSPISVATAMTMTWGGARGETAAEMQRTLHLDPAGAHESAGALLRGWNDPNQQAYDLRVANRLFVQASYDLDPAFVTLQRDTYEAPLTPVDFIGATEAARGEINRWVASR
ncbi:MAG: hypothetical protein H6719_37920, partial [Sandaracinaceae bacterium]|nr:hypothetical protein [Sandaracinaceae bacterium]